MKKTFLAALALVLLLPLTASTQNTVYQTKAATLLVSFNLNGSAANAARIVASANLADSTTYTIAAQPDVCRLVDMTVTDANSSTTAGVITIVGTDCLGDPVTGTYTFNASGSGVKTFTYSEGGGLYLSNVTSVITGVLTGEEGAGVDLITVGYTSNSVNSWGMNGVKTPRAPNGEHGVNPFAAYPVQKLITTSNASSTTVTSVATNAAFTNVSVGDLLEILLNGVPYERKVTARASADSITIDSAIKIPTAGVYFSYKKFYFSSDPTDMMSIPVESYTTVAFIWSVDANASTGGVVTNLQCTVRADEWPLGQWAQMSTTTVATGTAQSPTPEFLNLVSYPFTHCRFGLKFGTGDDGDGAPEDINLQVVLVK